MIMGKVNLCETEQLEEDVVDGTEIAETGVVDGALITSTSETTSETQTEDAGVHSRETKSIVQEEQALGRGHRISQPSVRLKDYIAYNSQCLLDKQTPASPAIPSRPSNSVQGTSSYPISSYVTDAVFSEKHQVFLAAITVVREPKNFKEAMLDPRWTNAMSTEVVALEGQRTWDVTSLPKGKKPLACMWVYKYKFNADGTVERPKARLVVCGVISK